MQKNKGHDNLIPITDRTEEERKEIAAKGGRAKAEKEKRRKIVAETFNNILSLTYDEPTPCEIDHLHLGYRYGFKDLYLDVDIQGQTVLTRLCAKIVHKAVYEGDMRAAETILRYIEPCD